MTYTAFLPAELEALGAGGGGRRRGGRGLWFRGLGLGLGRGLPLLGRAVGFLGLRGGFRLGSGGLLLSRLRLPLLYLGSRLLGTALGRSPGFYASEVLANSDGILLVDEKLL